MLRFFLCELRSDLRSYPATEIVCDAICACLCAVFVVAVTGLLVGMGG